MKLTLRMKILGSFALIVLVSLGIVTGIGSWLTFMRFGNFSLLRDRGRALTLAPFLFDWTAEVSEGPGGDMPMNFPFSQDELLERNRRTMRPMHDMMRPMHGDKGRMMNPIADRMVITDLEGRVLMDTADYGKPLLKSRDVEGVIINNQEKGVGYLYLGRMVPGGPGPEERVFFRTLGMATWIITALIFLAALVLGNFLTAHIVRPIRTMRAAAHRIGKGDLNTRVSIKRSDELGDLGRGFNAMADSLKNLDASRRHQIADSAHELRTPLSLIRARIEMLEEGHYPLDREALSSLSGEVDRLTMLVDELKTLSDLESPNAFYRQDLVNSTELLEEVLNAIRPSLDRQGLLLDVSIAEDVPDLIADGGKLRQVLTNLLTNARRYAKSRIGVNLHRMPEGGVEFSVEDDGPGIPVKERTKVFQRFYRVDSSRDRRSGGSGLGLAICFEIVSAHGGRIEAGTSARLGGALIRLALPRRDSPPLQDRKDHSDAS